MKMRTLTFCLLLFLQQAFSYAQPCFSGSAGAFPCANVALQSVVSPSALQVSEGENDIGKWINPLNGNKSAPIGLDNGTSLVNVSTPTNLIVLDFLPTNRSSSSLWRNFKIINNYAYVVSEASSFEMQIFDSAHTNPTLAGVFTSEVHDELYENSNRDKTYQIILTTYIIN